MIKDYYANCFGEGIIGYLIPERERESVWDIPRMGSTDRVLIEGGQREKGRGGRERERATEKETEKGEREREREWEQRRSERRLVRQLNKRLNTRVPLTHATSSRSRYPDFCRSGIIDFTSCKIYVKVQFLEEIVVAHSITKTMYSSVRFSNRKGSK